MTATPIPACIAPQQDDRELIEGIRESQNYDKAKRWSGGEEVVEMASSVDYCGKGAVVIAVGTERRIAIVPIRCKNWRCPTCGPILSRLWSRRIAEARPQRFMTLTCDPALHKGPQDAYEGMKAALPILIRTLRAGGVNIEYAATWELHASGYPHLHLLTKGDYIPDGWLSSVWGKLQMGSIVDIRKVDDVKGAACYVAKYVAKALAAAKATVRFTRLVQVSRHFFEAVLFKRENAPKGSTAIVHTRRHYAQVVSLLVEEHGFTFHMDNDSNTFFVLPPKHLSWEEVVSLLNSVV